MIEHLLRFLASLRLTLTLLLAIAFGAVAGTIVPQNLSADDYERLFHPFLLSLLQALQIFDVYRSWWFVALLLLLAINLALCSWRRLPTLWKNLHQIPPTPPDHPDRQFTHSFSPTGNDPQTIGATASSLMAKHFAAPRDSVIDGALFLVAQRGVWTRLAVFVIHGAILLILAGGVIGLFWGFQGYAIIPEGQTVHELQSRREQRSIPLDFGLRCDAFRVTFHEGSHRPKEFKTLLSIVEKGEIRLERRPITVNAPLSFRGITLYQADYGPAAPARVSLRLQPPLPGAPFDITLSPGETSHLPRGGALRLLRFAPSFRDLGPTALVEVSKPNGQSYSQPVFQNRSDMAGAHPDRDYQIRISDFKQPYYTVLLATRDPGVPLVWTGFILLTAGLATTFFFSQKRLWIAIRPNSHGLTVTVTGERRRKSPGGEAFFRRFAEALENELAKGN